ncbi:MAG: hypothetical protein KBD53_05895 [Candidatus Omnitrophica bacterium]|nr:hypothetical protein [Candidatus Omnitrophota bacterium]
MNKDLKKDYKKSLNALRNIFNSFDPEGLEPGQVDGAPCDEYDAEIAKIYAYIVHNLETIKLNKHLLIDAINKIWMESFGNECRLAREVSDKIIKEFF